MFFRKAFNGFNEWWRYAIVIVAVFLGYVVGQIPLFLALSRSASEGSSTHSNPAESFAENPNFELFGINNNMGFALLILSFVAAITALFFIFKPIHQREFKTLITPSSKIKWDKIFFAFFVWLGLALVLEGVAFALAPDNYTFQFKWNTFIPLVILSALLLPVQTSTEELIFRSYLFQGIGTKKLKQIIPFLLSLGLSKVVYNFSINATNGLEDFYEKYSLPSIIALLAAIISAFVFYKILEILFDKISHSDTSILNKNYKVIPLIVTAIAFGLLHLNNPEIEKFGVGIMQVYYISAGLTLGIMTIMDDSLELALGVHAATNFAGAVFVGYEGAAIRTDSLFTTNNLNPVFMTLGFIAMSIIFLIIVKYKYNWSSFGKIFNQIDQSKNIV